MTVSDRLGPLREPTGYPAVGQAHLAHLGPITRQEEMLYISACRVSLAESVRDDLR